MVRRSCLRSVERYSPEDDEWTTLSPLITPRRALAAVALPSGIYVLGGYDGANYLNSVEKYEYATGLWTYLSPMKYARCTLAAVASPDSQYIFAIGGFNGAAVRVVERYSVLEDHWSEVASLHDPRFMHSCVLVPDS